MNSTVYLPAKLNIENISNRLVGKADCQAAPGGIQIRPGDDVDRLARVDPYRHCMRNDPVIGE